MLTLILRATCNYCTVGDNEFVNNDSDLLSGTEIRSSWEIFGIRVYCIGK